MPLTGAMCLAVAARLPGTLVAELATARTESVRIAQPSGVSTLGVVVAVGPPAEARSVTVSRTARRLMEGRVLVPRARLSAAAERAA